MLWFGLILTFTLTALAIMWLAKLAPGLNLLAIPGEHRLHQQATPMVGGLGICAGLVAGIILFDQSSLRILPSLMLLCVVGALDDRYALPSWVRFLAQGIAAYLMIRMSGVALNDLGYLFSSDGRVLLGRWSTPMTIFATIGVINAVNMSDGLDGLAGSLIFISLVALLLIGHSNHNLILIALSTLAGFLAWNLRINRARASVFMGDAGSTMLGILLAYLLIKYSQADSGIRPVTALWLMALPLIDAVAVLIVRPLRGKSPFAADRIHYHHQLRDRGLSVNATLFTALALQALLILAGIFMLYAGVADHQQLWVFLSMFTAYVLRLIWFTRAKK